MLRKPLLLLLLSSVVFVAAVPAEEATVYSEDFSGFTVGDDTLLGTDGWIGTGEGRGLHGVDFLSEVFGNAGFLGYFPDTGSLPQTVSTRVGRPIMYDPLAEGTPEVTLAAIIGIQDSQNGEGDNFYISVYNSTGQEIASVNFDNSGETPTVFRFDGVDFFATGADFFYDSFIEFTAEIDFENNIWSAFLGDAPIFLDAPFSSRDVTQDFGFLFFEWEVYNTGPLRPGDNWILFDELEILVEAPDFSSPVPLGNGLSFFTEPAYSYQVEYSDDLSTWETDLEGSAKPAGEPAGMCDFIDSTAPLGGHRYYRVVRELAL